MLCDKRLVEHAHPACRDGAHRKLLVAGNAQLTHGEDIEWGAERAGHFMRDGYAATWEGKDKHIRLVGIGGELSCE
jgi:hypothetical protein